MLDTTANPPAPLPQQATAHAYDPAPTPSGCRHAKTWHVAATKPRSERIALAALHHRGYNPYLPLLLNRPLFPGYLFLQLGIGQPWYPIAWCPGVYNLLQCQGKPSIVAEADIRALQAGDELRATPIPKSAQWAPGMPCSLPIGPGLPAVVMALSRNTATIAAIMFGQLRQVEVTLNYLKPRGDA